MLLILGQRTQLKSEAVKKISSFFVNSENTLCLELGTLSAVDSAALVCAVFQVTSIPRPLAAAVYDKCKGHPRFVLEISELLLSEGKVVIEDGTCTVDRDDYENLQLPSSIRAGQSFSSRIKRVSTLTKRATSVFVSRMDQLSSSEQITLKVASVIGPVFR